MQQRTTAEAMLQQLIRLLSEPPGTIVYQLVTLFAIQVTLALAYWQWRRVRRAGGWDDFAWRLMWASAGLLAGRLLLAALLFFLVNQPDSLAARQLLPPIEQALNTATIILLAWALLPPTRLPRLTSTLALLLLILTAVLLLFFLQEWPARAVAGATYNATQQATIWGILQLLLAGGSTIWLLLRPASLRGLRVAILFILTMAHAVHLWNFPEIIPSSSEIPYWIRLGHLLAFPLWVALAYRYVLLALLQEVTPTPRPVEQEPLARLLRSVNQVTQSQDPATVSVELFQMIARVLDTRVLALALLDLQDEEALTGLVQPQDSPFSQPVVQTLALADWVSLRLALEQQQAVELQASGMGAYQLQGLAAELAIPDPSVMMIEPLLNERYPVGLLLVGWTRNEPAWSAQRRSLVPLYASLAASLIANARTYQQALLNVAPMTPAAEASVTGRIIALEEERDRALTEVELLQARLRHAEAQVAEEQQRTADLAATLATLEEMTPAGNKVAELEKEITTLREALYEAEETMAMVAAGEGGLSTEWVMLTISRYSAELEQAQVRIEALTNQLAQREPDQRAEIMLALVQELRTPLTSIEGYTDLLLSDVSQVVDSQQRDFLHRVKANAERMNLLLEQMVRLATPPPTGRATAELVDVREEIENAISMVMSQLRKKKQLLSLDVAPETPALPLPPNDLCEIMVHLLNNASQSSDQRSRIAVRAHPASIGRDPRTPATEAKRFVHLSVSDSSSGIRPEDLSRVFDAQMDATHPLITGLGDTSAGLAVAQALVNAHGGRLWVSSLPGQGTTFSVLLVASENGSNGNGHSPQGPAA